jgi:hypothetical protein
VDEELKQYLDAMKRETKLDLDAMRRDIRVDLESLRSDLMAHNEAVETRLLGEFFKWARTADARYRQNQGVVAGLDERVQVVEDRVAELERRK